MIRNLLILLMLHSVSWADDIYFLSPTHRQPVSKVFKIKIIPPDDNINVRVWIESERTEEILWWGFLKAEQDYTIEVDADCLSEGPIEIEAEYFLYGKNYEGEIKVWVNHF